MKLLLENWQGFLNESYEKMPDQLAAMNNTKRSVCNYETPP
jgi:16S rRNA C1402 (ribose-2'-O) methylase RsmI